MKEESITAYYFILIIISRQGTAKSDAAISVAIKKFMFTTKFYRNREANTLKMVNHQNIVKFIAMEKDELNTPVLIMEYCSEGDMQNYLENPTNKNGLPSNEFRIFLQSFVDALKHLSEKHIVHRDLKPSNILITVYNERRVYKIADFGAARVLNPNERYTSLYGTAEYLHPDIFANFYAYDLDKCPSKRSFSELHELWSIGATLYEAATGNMPFNPKNGRRSPKILYQMTKEKQNGNIAAMEIENGKIQWMSQMPESCALDEVTKKNLTTLLSGLFEVSITHKISFRLHFSKCYLFQPNEENAWSKQKFFTEAEKTLSSQQLSRLRKYKVVSSARRKAARKKLSILIKWYRKKR